MSSRAYVAAQPRRVACMHGCTPACARARACNPAAPGRSRCGSLKQTAQLDCRAHAASHTARFRDVHAHAASGDRCAHTRTRHARAGRVQQLTRCCCSASAAAACSLTRARHVPPRGTTDGLPQKNHDVPLYAANQRISVSACRLAPITFIRGRGDGPCINTSVRLLRQNMRFVVRSIWHLMAETKSHWRMNRPLASEKPRTDRTRRARNKAAASRKPFFV